MLLNAIGDKPSPTRLEDICRQTLGIDEDETEVVPGFYRKAIDAFLTTNPGDGNFLIELGAQKNKSLGGNGYGTITCMEDLCWSDTILGPDVNRPEGGKKDGFGSMEAYKSHCFLDDHMKARNERLRKTDQIIPPRKVSTPGGKKVSLIQKIKEMDEAKSKPKSSPPSSPSSTPGPSTFRDKKPFPIFSSSGSTLDKGKGKAKAIDDDEIISISSDEEDDENRADTIGDDDGFDLSDESDDGIEFLSATAGALKAKSRPGPGKSVYVFDSDNDNDNDEDEILVKPKVPQPRKTYSWERSSSNLGSSQPSQPLKSSQPSSSTQSSATGSSSIPTWLSIWRSMSIQSKGVAYKREKEYLRPYMKDTKRRGWLPEESRAVARRFVQVCDLVDSNGLLPWTPPSPEVLARLPSYRSHLSYPLNTALPEIKPPVKPPVQDKALPGGWPASAVPPGPKAPRPAFAPYAAAASSSSSPFPSSNTNVIAPSANQNLIGILANRISQAASQQLANPQTLVERNFAAAMEALSGSGGFGPRYDTAPSSSFSNPPMAGQLSQGLHNAMAGPSKLFTTSSLFGPHKAIVPPPVNPEMAAYIEELGYEHDRPRNQRDLGTFLQNSIEEFAEDEKVDDALKKLGLETIESRIPGATFQLMAHQVLGVSFMIEREKRQSCKGGILADAMGLGKTVQCIALLLARNERPKDYKKAPVLIVCPVALMQQWKAEIESKTTTNWKICIYHGPGRPKQAASLRQYDIVITSYSILASESKSDPKPRRKKLPGDANDSDESDLEIEFKKPGPVMACRWFRVILDEAQYARNKNTRTAKAISQLDVLHPWVLTGTPIVNSLGDLFPQLRFLGVVTWEEFRDKVFKFEKKKPKLAAKRAMAILKPVMMRRTKDSEINGHRILQLPPKETTIVQLDFTPDERAIYEAVQQRAQIRFNQFLKRGEVIKNYHQVLVMLTRLRQLCNHPWLLRRKPGEEAQPGDLLLDENDDLYDLGLGPQDVKADVDEMDRAVQLLGHQVVERMRQKLEEMYNSLQSGDDSNAEVEIECSICLEPLSPINEMITPCCHSFCDACLLNLFEAPLREGLIEALNEEQQARGCRACPMCRGVLEKGRVFRARAIFRPPTPTPEPAPVADTKPDIKSFFGQHAASGSSKRAFKADDDVKPIKRVKLDASSVDSKPRIASASASAGPSTEAADSDAEIEEQVEAAEVDELEDEDTSVAPPSTKMIRMAELLDTWLQEDPSIKVLVFSQFVGFLDIIKAFLVRKQINHYMYRGGMTQNARNEAVRRFSTPIAVDPTSPRVMLLSTKAGGVGLNLTVANKVLCLDLCWSPATENQAVDRAHRIGQTKPVDVQRVVIRNSVEDRLMKIQERKGALAAGALGEGEAGRMGRLGIAELRELFGVAPEYEPDEDDDY